jgi:hypothetical protein
VYFLYFALVFYSLTTMRSHHTRYETIHFLLYVGALSAALVLICWRKGEPPKWRWGK